METAGVEQVILALILALAMDRTARRPCVSN